MFKKIILVIVVLLPFWYSLFIGYPVVTNKDYQLRMKEATNYSVSRRCFGVGDFNQFMSCFNSKPRLHGISFLSTVLQKTDQISFVITLLICFSFTIFIITGVIVLMKKKL